MDISKMSDQEKSVLLARAMGWVVSGYKDQWGKLFTLIQPPDLDWLDDVDGWPLNLYDPANMALAWRVVEFALDQENHPDSHERYDIFAEFYQWAYGGGFEEGQRAWLDKVLELAIEAGLVPESNGE